MANTKHSTGPTSIEGKLRSSGNAIKHGLYSKSAVLRNEDRAEYDALVQSFVAQKTQKKFQPGDVVELRLVQRMADCEWRMIRARYIETATLDIQMDAAAQKTDSAFESIDEAARLAFAMQQFDRPNASVYVNTQRQENRLHRQFERVFKLLIGMQAHQPASPGLHGDVPASPVPE